MVMKGKIASGVKLSKHVLSAVLAVALTAGLCPTVAYADAPSDGNSTDSTAASREADANGFVIDENGVLTDYIGTATDIVIPEGVVEIGKSVFKNSNVETVVFPESLRTIGSYAFAWSHNLKKVSFPDNLVEIGAQAFNECTALAVVSISNGEEKPIGSVWPSSLKEIGSSAFACNKNISELVFPSGLETIEGNAFGYNNNLESVYIPTSLTQESANAWSPFFLPEEMDTADAKHLSVQFEEGTTKVVNGLFEGARALKSIILPDTITEVGSGAFSRSGLTTVDFPDSLTTIGANAFSHCLYLETFSIDESKSGQIGEVWPSGLSTIEDYAFENCPQIENVVLPEGITEVGQAAFSDLSNLKSVSIPKSLNETFRPFDGSGTADNGGLEVSFADGIEIITDSLFQGCVGLTSITIPDTVVEIGNSTFTGAGLTSITIPSSVAKIGSGAFSGNSELATVDLPDSLERIPISIFGYCPNLKTISFGGGEPGPVGMTWPSKLKEIGDYAFEGVPFRELRLPEGLTEIGSEAFSRNPELETVYIPSTVEGASEAFKGYGAPEESKEFTAVIADGMTEIPKGLFEEAIGLVSIDLPESIRTIGDNAFSKCSSLANVTIAGSEKKPVGTAWPSTLTTIGKYAFDECDLLRDVILPEGLETLGYRAFGSNPQIEAIHIPSTLKSADEPFYIYSYSDEDCESAVVTFGLGLKSIVGELFEFARGITSITIPDSIESIGEYAFLDCSNLRDVYIPDSVSSIGEYSFTRAGGDINETLLFHCSEGSYAQQYAVAHNIAWTENEEHVHSFDEWIIDKESTYYEEGHKYRVCVECGYKEEQSIPTLSASLEDHPDYTLAKLRIVDASSTEGVNEASVAISNDEGESYEFNTDADGNAVFFAPAGTYHVLVSANGYQARAFDYNFTAGEMAVPDIAISTGSLVTGELTVTEMTKEEIEDAGIAVDDPDNSHVFKYEVTLVFKDGLQQIEIPSITYKNEKGEVVGGSFGGVPFQPGSGGQIVYKPNDTTKVVMVNEYLYIVIQGEAKWLKEMFHAQLILVNSSNVDTMTETTATLDLPEGLSLAAMEGSAQSLTQDLGTIETGGTKTVDWYIRGDVAGDYDIGASVDTTFSPLGDKQTFEFKTAEPIHVYAGNDMRLTVHASDAAYPGQMYGMIFELENVSDHEIYNVVHEVKNVSQYEVVKYTYIEDGRVVDTEEEFNQLSSVNLGPDGKITDEVFEPGEKLVVYVKTRILWESPLQTLKSNAEDADALLGILALCGVPGVSAASAVTSLIGYIDVRYNLVGAFVQTLEGSTAEIPVVFDIRHDAGVSLVDKALEILVEKAFNTAIENGIEGVLGQSGKEWYDFESAIYKGLTSVVDVKGVDENTTVTAYVDAPEGSEPAIEITSANGTVDENGKLVLAGGASIDVKAKNVGTSTLVVEDETGNVAKKRYVVKEQLPGQNTFVADEDGSQSLGKTPGVVYPAGSVYSQEFHDLLAQANMEMQCNGTALNPGDAIPNGTVLKDNDTGAAATIYVPGDANSDARVNLFDAYAVADNGNAKQLDDAQNIAGDLDGNGTSDASDATQLLEYLSDEGINTRDYSDEANEASGDAQGTETATRTGTIPLAELLAGYENVRGVQIDFLDLADAGVDVVSVANDVAGAPFDKSVYNADGDYARTIAATFDNTLDAGNANITVTCNTNSGEIEIPVRVLVQTADGSYEQNVRTVAIALEESSSEPVPDPDPEPEPEPEPEPTPEPEPEPEPDPAPEPEPDPAPVPDPEPEPEPTPEPEPSPDPGQPDNEEVIENPDGSTTTTTTTADGSVVVTETDSNGEITSIEAEISEAAAGQGSVTLPVKPLPANGENCPEIVITVDSDVEIKVTIPVAKDESGAVPQDLVLCKVEEDGTVTVLPKTAVLDDGLVVYVTGSTTLKAVKKSVAFPDITGDEWYADEVVPFVSSRGIMSGVYRDGDEFFDGDVQTTRAMFVTMLHRLEQEPAAAGTIGFTDVPSGAWYEPAVRWGQETKLVQGYGGTTLFGGEDLVTREQLAVFLMRYAEWLGIDTSARADVSQFPDAANVSPYAQDAISWAVAEGLLYGDGGTGELRPTSGSTRAEAAAVIMRFINQLLV